MTEHRFHVRSHAQYAGTSNDLVALTLEVELEGAWQAIVLGTSMPPFRAFVSSLMLCQHKYSSVNAAERGLSLGEVRGELWVGTEDWLVHEVTSHFQMQLLSGLLLPEHDAFIAERIRDCPISRNLTGARKKTTLEVVSSDP